MTRKEIRKEIVDSYAEGQITRRQFLRKLTATGVSLGAALTYSSVIGAEKAFGQEIIPEDFYDDHYGEGGPEGPGGTDDPPPPPPPGQPPPPPGSNPTGEGTTGNTHTHRHPPRGKLWHHGKRHRRRHRHDHTFLPEDHSE